MPYSGRRKKGQFFTTPTWHCPGLDKVLLRKHHFASIQASSDTSQDLRVVIREFSSSRVKLEFGHAGPKVLTGLNQWSDGSIAWN